MGRADHACQALCFAKAKTDIVELQVRHPQGIGFELNRALQADVGGTEQALQHYASSEWRQQFRVYGNRDDPERFGWSCDNPGQPRLESVLSYFGIELMQVKVERRPAD